MQWPLYAHGPLHGTYYISCRPRAEDEARSYPCWHGIALAAHHDSQAGIAGNTERRTPHKSTLRVLELHQVCLRDADMVRITTWTYGRDRMRADDNTWQSI